MQVSQEVMCQQEQWQDPETEAAERNAATINGTIYTCAFNTETCQNVPHVKTVSPN